jgi:hypothetical protein
MDRFDRVFCWAMSCFAIVLGSLLLIRRHGIRDIVMVGCVCVVLARWPWIEIPKRSKEARILGSVCGNFKDSFVCVLEPNHPGDHRSAHSSGGYIGWPK